MKKKKVTLDVFQEAVLPMLKAKHVDPAALQQAARQAALAHLAAASEAIATYGNGAYDERERADALAGLQAAAVAWPVDLDGLDAGCEVAARWYALSNELHTLEAEAAAVAQGWQGQVA